MASEPDGSHGPNSTYHPPLNPVELKRRVMTESFYSTYDVMTGVRIAATLGGFFGLMVILVLYKSKSKTEKALEDPDFTAAAVAEVEEEDERQLAAVLEASVYQQLNPRRARRSLDTVAGVPPGWLKATARFSSIGGYSSLMEPPTRAHSRLPSLLDDEDTPPLYDDVYYNRHLEVPRRSSNITCSSSGSSYLERPDSAVALPAHKSRPNRRQSSPLLEIYDFYYSIDIKVIQPTPGGSPCGSNRQINDPPALLPRLAPLASISSCNSSSLGPEFDAVSDSVFDDGNDDDTDVEIEQFSTDSESEVGATAACYQRKKKKVCCVESITPVNSSSTLIDDEGAVSEVRIEGLGVGAKETLF